MKKLFILGLALCLLLTAARGFGEETETPGLPREVIEALRGERNISAWHQNTWQAFSLSTEGLGNIDAGQMAEVRSFAVADLNGDGVNEFIAAAYAGNRFVGIKYLLWDGQRVLGMENSPNFFLSPKQDGTCSYDERMDTEAAGGRCGFMRYDSAAGRFLVNVYQETDEDGVIRYHEYRAPAQTHFMAVDREVSREGFEAMWQEQQAKPDLPFYPYSTENLARFLD